MCFLCCFLLGRDDPRELAGRRPLFLFLGHPAVAGLQAGSPAPEPQPPVRQSNNSVASAVLRARVSQTARSCFEQSSQSRNPRACPPPTSFWTQWDGAEEGLGLCLPPRPPTVERTAAKSPQALHPQAPEEEGVCLDQPPGTAGPETRVRSEWLLGWLCEGLGRLDVGTVGC